MDSNTLNTLLETEEDEHIEFKEAKSTFDFDKLVEYTVALANERGGRLVLGVTDKKPRKIIGTKAYEEGMAKIKERLIAHTRLRVEVEEIKDPRGRVLVFHVPARPIGMPLHLNGRYLMRAGGATAAMPPDMLKRIFDESGPDFTAEFCPGTSLEDLDPAAINDFRKRWAKKSGNTSISGLPVGQLLADAELAGGGKVTYAALILFGTHAALGGLLGQAEVIFEYRANDASGPAQQRIDFRQGFFTFYDKLWDTIDLRNTNQHFQDGLFIWDIKTFNESAIREAVLNAVSHRDYRVGASVFVRQYPERIEIVSPGGPPPGISLDNILWEQLPRNRRLAETFARCGLVERSGQGMNRIWESCIRESKGDPDFTHTDADHFWITLHGTIRQPEFLRLLEKIGSERLSSFTTTDFMIIQTVFDGRPVPERFHETAKMLCDEGLLEKLPRGKQAAWILSRKMYAVVGKQGVHTRKKGLDRSTHKELLLKHIRESEPGGAKMLEFRQVLPHLGRGAIQGLLREMRDEGIVHSHGKTNSGKWYIGKERLNCVHEKNGNNNR